eukprot:Tamp_03640.p1 GENE.Tamp_03640~~Tamp_03640.p1  ORF type:complete len:402 (+),score=78.66 Tamp_03640:2065-3270(+)
MKSNRKSKEANVKFSDIEEERDTLKALVAQQKRQIEELEKERNALQAVVSHDEQHLKEQAEAYEILAKKAEALKMQHTEDTQDQLARKAHVDEVMIAASKAQHELALAMSRIRDLEAKVSELEPLKMKNGTQTMDVEALKLVNERLKVECSKHILLQEEMAKIRRDLDTVACEKELMQEENKRVARENEKLAGQIHDVQHNLNEMTRRRAEAEAAEAPEAVAGVGLFLAYPVDGAGNDIYGVGFIVIQVTPGGSAYNNGRVMVGDRLVSIDGENVTNLRMQAIVSRIGGPGGSKVCLEFVRDDADTTVKITLTRTPAAHFALGASHFVHDCDNDRQANGRPPSPLTSLFREFEERRSPSPLASFDTSQVYRQAIKEEVVSHFLAGLTNAASPAHRAHRGSS